MQVVVFVVVQIHNITELEIETLETRISTLLEMLLKDLLHNNKPLERQDDKEINKILEANGWNQNIQTLWPITKEYFKRYQNAFVKHDDGERITEEDADLCFKQALLLIMSLVCKK